MSGTVIYLICPNEHSTPMTIACHPVKKVSNVVATCPECGAKIERFEHGKDQRETKVS